MILAKVMIIGPAAATLRAQIKACNHMSRKQILITVSGLTIVLLIALGIWLVRRPSDQSPAGMTSGESAGGSLKRTEFMTTQEKASFELPEDSRVQVISRDGGGQISVYKIIKSEEDIVPDPSQLAPISPSVRER